MKEIGCTALEERGQILSRQVWVWVERMIPQRKVKKEIETLGFVKMKLAEGLVV